MKIAIVSPYISSSTDLEFYQSQQINLGAELTKLGLKVDIITARRLPEQSSQSNINDQLRIFRLPTIAKWTERLLKQPIMLGLWRQLKKEDYDFIQSSECNTISTFIVGLYVLFKKSRFIIYQGFYSYSSKRIMKAVMVLHSILVKPFLKRVYCKAICKTSQAAKYLHKRGLTKTKVIPVGVNTSLFYPRERETKSCFGLLTVGDLIPRKNYPLILKVYQQLLEINPDFRLTIIGSGSEKNNIVNFIMQNGLDEKVYLLENVPNDRMQTFYSQADLLLLFSKVEIFGMVILEAMACGCPVLSTPTPGALDVITDGINGFIISNNNPTEIARRISDIFADSAKYEIIRENATRTAQEKYSWQVIANQYYEFYHEKINC
jgi:glycosyltransferase involved in cell wall biosynthesis